MAKVGRKSKYDTVILPRMEEIKELIQQGYSEKQIANKIGVSYTTWKTHKRKIESFSTIILTGREKNIDDLEKSMFQQALGFTKTVTKAMKLKTVTYGENGKRLKEEERIEYYDEVVYIPPSFNATRFLLMNWNKEGYSMNPAELDLKKEELERKKEEF